jgi:hypothetical protein
MVTKIIDALFMAELMVIRKMKNLKIVKPTTFTIFHQVYGTTGI